MKTPPKNEMITAQQELERDLAQTELEDDLKRLADQRIAQDAGVTIEQVVKDADIDRIMTGCNLVNAFNFAIQQQAKREIWTSDDYRAFCIALSAMNAIK